MTKKTHKTFSIDHNIAIKMTLNQTINWSNIINDFLNSYINTETNNKDINILKNEIKELNFRKSKIEEEIIQKNAELLQLRDKYDKKNKKENDIKLKKYRAIINSGIVGEIAGNR